MAGWQNMAEENYAAASALVSQKQWRSAISRAYYAAFALVANSLTRSGVSMPRDWEGPSHAKVAALICDKLTALRDARWRVFHWVKALYALRLDADYRPSLAIGNAHARRAVAIMAEVFHHMKETA